jgi:hypothetical protein
MMAIFWHNSSGTIGEFGGKAADRSSTVGTDGVTPGSGAPLKSRSARSIGHSCIAIRATAVIDALSSQERARTATPAFPLKPL